MKNYIEQSGESQGIDFDAHYQVSGYRGIAFYLLGWAVTREAILCYSTDDDGNEIEVESGDYDDVADYSNVIAVMVGDDRKHTVSPDDLTKIPEDGFCRDCGQTGCHCNVYA